VGVGKAGVAVRCVLVGSWVLVGSLVGVVVRGDWSGGVRSVELRVGFELGKCGSSDRTASRMFWVR